MAGYQRKAADDSGWRRQPFAGIEGLLSGVCGWRRTIAEELLVPLAGIEPALLAELDFESSASTNSATGAFGHRPQGGQEADVAKPAEYSGRALPVNPRVAGRAEVSESQKHSSVIAVVSTVSGARDTTLRDMGDRCDT
jgi:hypothetical protein